MYVTLRSRAVVFSLRFVMCAAVDVVIVLLNVMVIHSKGHHHNHVVVRRAIGRIFLIAARQPRALSAAAIEDKSAFEGEFLRNAWTRVPTSRT